MEEKVVQTLREGSLLRVEINRPKSLNALNREVLESLRTTFEELKGDTSLRAVIITGAGEKAFVAGADIQSMSDLDEAGIRSYVELGQQVMRSIEQCHVPVIAAVNGFALGGGLELALSCDIILASSKAKLGQPEVNLGIIPGFGGTQRLIYRCGVGTARRLCYTGDILSAEEGARLGIVDQVFEPEALLEQAHAMAQTIASKGPLAVWGAKEVIREAQDGLLCEGLSKEVEKFLELFQSADRKEGMAAFLEKRTPDFTGQ
ncbi:MAG: enoyl-CoA hydratase/isomerase family protein [Bdellovibrionales bacterium]|nr:enoyl-CoA hydratase/isomerase family protein [Bdellovibrionales bacterium]